MPKPSALLWLPLALAAAGCGPEPYDRPGTWRATGANERNLRAMVADPAHLTRGTQPAVPTRGEAAAGAAALAGPPRDQGPGATGPNRIPALPQPLASDVR